MVHRQGLTKCHELTPSFSRARRGRRPSTTNERNFPIGNQALLRQLSDVSGSPIQRQPTTAVAVPVFPNCTAALTGVSNPNEKLDVARNRARDFTQAAIKELGKTPVAGSTLDIALARHFISPTATERATIRDTYRSMLPAFRAANFVCNTQAFCGPDFQALWDPADDLIHVCPSFFQQNLNCRAIILVHEAAHDAGINVSGPHPFSRGSASYPTGNEPPPAGMTTAQRIDNPDAFGFFAAHVARETDTGFDCR